jgi:hypothetical protein
MQRLLVAVGVIALLVLAAAPAAAQGEYKEFLLNAERYAKISGDVSFVALTVGTIVLSDGTKVHVHPDDRVVLKGVSADTSSEFKVKIGSDGRIDIKNLHVDKLEIVRNGELYQEWQDVEIKDTRCLQVDLSSVETSLTIHVPPDDKGHTYFEFDNEVIIDGVSSDEIVIVNIRPSGNQGLEISASKKNNIHAMGVAEAAYVNGSEVPEIGLAALGSTAVLAAALLLARRVRPVMSHVG